VSVCKTRVFPSLNWNFKDFYDTQGSFWELLNNYDVNVTGYLKQNAIEMMLWASTLALLFITFKKCIFPLLRFFFHWTLEVITLYPPDLIVLEICLLLREVCLFLSFTFIENIIESTFAMLAFHFSHGQFKLPIITWKVSKMWSTLSKLAGNKVNYYYYFLTSYHKT